ncbi:MAG: glycosyltransferase [Lachnospiraceae bacterium]|nr:glycosyltransferase [Lachnospiraceae bacterium]
MGICRGYYIDNIAFGHPHGKGVDNKIKMQVESMGEFAEISLLYLEDIPIKTIGKIAKRLPFCSTNRDYSKLFKKIELPDFLYIRRVNLDLKFILFLKKLRKKFPTCKLLFEIPTYPYKGEMLAVKGAVPLYIKDFVYRQFLRFYVDRIVIFDNQKKLFGIDCIYTMNGIIVNKYNIIKDSMDNRDSINIVYVGALGSHHGLERIIEGMRVYYEGDKKTIKKVVLECAGDGPSEEYYRNLVEKYNLSEYVIFHGYLNENELNELYDKADIALAPLGMYKIGIYMGSFLKVREYLAKGLPIVTGCDLDVFNKYPCNYGYNVGNNDSIIDIDGIVQFYGELRSKYKDKHELSCEIHKYAEMHVDYSVVQKPIQDYIEGK